MPKYVVYEVEYPEDGSELIEAKDVDAAITEWRRMSGCASGEEVELSVTLATPEQVNAHIGFALAEGVMAIQQYIHDFGDHTRPGEPPSKEEVEGRYDDLAEACEVYLKAYKAMKEAK